MSVQTVAWITSLFFMLLITAVFAFVLRNASKEREPYDPIKKKWYKARKFYAITLVVFLLAMAVHTLRDLPYDMPVYGQGKEATIVDVEAMQFGWNMSKTEFKVGEPIEFDVTSKDVNHGFGIYDESKTMLAQTQAMPNYTNKVYITFDKPGTYEVLCLEYCGLAHHQMIGKFTVKE